jgi:Flp pilus assembly protein TadD
LTLTGESESAGTELAEAARLSPDNVVARLDYGLWLMQRRHWDAAQQEFEAVLRLDPSNPPAQQNLAWLRGNRR